MTDKEKHDRQAGEEHPPTEAEAPDAAERAANDAATNNQPGADSPEAAEQKVEQDLADALSTVQKERDELEQRLLRIAADYQNYVRRSEQHSVTAREQQLIEMAKSLVTVMDHFDRALEVDPEKTSTKDLLNGVKIVREELLRVLQRFGIQRIDVERGEPFDPNRHEAMMRQATEDLETNHVAQQLQPGYVLNEKTIRPAKVAVAE